MADISNLSSDDAMEIGKDFMEELPPDFWYAESPVEWVRRLQSQLDDAAEMYKALRFIWEADDMGWITGGDGMYECGSCNATPCENKLEIKHEEGCVQGIMAKAIVAWESYT